MASNTYSNLNPADVIALANRMYSTIHASGTTPNAYGVSAAQLTALSGASNDLAYGQSDVAAAKDAYHAAVTERDVRDGACKEAIGAIAKTIYANPAVTDTMIRAAGLQPRATTRTKIVPVTPTGLTASVQENGDVLLRWKKGANAVGVIYRILEATPEGWSMIADTTAARITLRGYAPGETASFCVVASKNGLEATPSAQATVYPAPLAAAKPALRLAA